MIIAPSPIRVEQVFFGEKLICWFSFYKHLVFAWFVLPLGIFRYGEKPVKNVNWRIKKKQKTEKMRLLVARLLNWIKLGIFADHVLCVINLIRMSLPW